MKFVLFCINITVLKFCNVLGLFEKKVYVLNMSPNENVLQINSDKLCKPQNDI